MFMGIVCGALALMVVPLILLAPLPGVATLDQRVALAALSIGVLVSLFGGLSEAIFRSTGRYATGTMLGNFVRLGEWLGCMIGLATIGSFAAVALGGLTVRLAGTLAVIVVAQRGRHGLRWGMHAADRTEIRAMLKPALSFMAFPLANALSFQGVTLLVGALFGPVAVALFNTYRTIARVAVQVTAIFSYALWPEFSRLFGQGAMATVNRLFLRASLLGAAQALLLSLALYFLSPWLLSVWTHGAIEFIPSLMLLMLLYAAVGGLWHIPRVLLMATNQHVGLAYWSILAGMLSVGLAWLLSRELQLNGAGAAMLVSELFIAIVCSLLAYSAVTVNNKTKAVAQ
jgi:O-antigen/teichoic acid export membrane protein